MIDKIFHLADIHIRNFKRHKEYRLIFDQLFATISQLATSRSIITVGGDIVHSKTELTPEGIKLITDLLKGLADICPVYIILGNHDCNLQNENRLDAISPIVHAISSDKIQILEQSTSYLIDEVGFYVYSMNNTEYPEKLPDTKVRIALYHGQINGSKGYMGYTFDHGVPMSIFDGFDYVLLGDIHKRQVLQQQFTDEFGTKKPLIYYPGSLIQQNFGEDVREHGFSVLDLEEQYIEFYDLDNEYGYYTLYIENGELTSNLDRVTDKARVRLKISNTSLEEEKRIITNIKKNKTLSEIIIQRDTLQKLNNFEHKEKDALFPVRDINYQNEKIEEYLINLKVDADLIDGVKKLNVRFNKNLKEETVIRNVYYELIDLSFSNMFSYGENNYLDFNLLKGIVGIHGKNANGKSSLLDVICYTQFGKSSRTNKAKEVLNRESDFFESKLRFRINDLVYTISRKGAKQSGERVKEVVEFYYEKDGEIISLNGKDRYETNAKITEYLGNFEDFILTSFSSQNGIGSFIDKTQAEKKDLLSSFLDISVFENLHELAKSDSADKRVEFKLINKELTELQDKYDDSLKQIEEKKIIVDKIEVLKELLNKELTEYNQQQEDLLKSIKLIENIPSKQELERKLYFENNNLKNTVDSLFNKETEIEKSQKHIKKLEDLSRLKELEKEINKLYEVNDKIGELGTEQQLLIFTLEGIKKSENILSEIEYDKNCKYCVKNVEHFIKDVEQKQEKENRLKEVEDLLHDLIKQRAYYGTFEREYGALKIDIAGIGGLENRLKQVRSEVVILKNNIESIKGSILLLEDKIKQADQLEDVLKHNENIKQSIESVKEKIYDTNKKINEVNTLEKNTLVELQNLQNIIEKYENFLNKLKELEQDLKVYDLYLKCVQRDGIPYQIISNTIIYLEEEVNNILSNLVDFKVILKATDNSIEGYIGYDDENCWALELISGMERFLTSIAIRNALLNITTLPKSNYFAIDEGFGVLDGENMGNVYSLFEYLKTKFDFILSISHIDYMRDLVDKSIDIKKEGNFSKIYV